MDNWIFKYHEAIQKKEVIVGVWVRLCFEILTTGLLNGEWEFNEKKANKAIKFIENFCHHSEGRSDLLHLELWQKAIVSAIFGIMDKTTGYRQFREVFIIVARKNGKTLFAAAIAAYMTYIDGEYGAKVYFLAPKLDQADLVYDAFYQIVQSDDELDSITKKRRSDIYIKAFNTSVKKIAFNSKKSDGFNPQLVVNDEMEAWPGDQGLKQYEVMTSALGARKQPLIISIATAGYVNDGIFDELFKRATAFLKGNSREKRLLPFIYMIDDIEKWDSIEELKKSNPNLGVSVSAEYYLEQIEIARNSISKKVEFMTKFCNIKQNSAVAWLDYWDVMKCVHEDKPLALEDFKGCYCVVGIDLSRTTDLTAASIIINRDGINHVFTRFYMPQKRYEIAINEDNTPYNIYRDRGFLFISGENQVDYKDVYNWLIELVKVYKIKPLKIGYDRYSASYLVDDLKTAGFHTDDVYQGTNLTPILHMFEGELKDGNFDFGDNSMLASHFLNVAVDINLNDSRMKPVKIEKRMRIDGAMSVFDALTMVSKYHNEIGKKLLNKSRETAKTTE
jgi:phage terminase large subunit-like protein